MNNQTKRIASRGGRFDFYTYLVPGTLAFAPGNVTANLPIQADSNFILSKITYAADIAAAVQTDSTRVIPLIRFQISEVGTSLFSDFIPVPALAGDGRLPYILPVARQFAANSSITVQLTNYSAGTTYNLYLALHGWKEYLRA